jgi:hypothetical protein
VFFLLFGSSGSGKTLALDALRDCVDGLAIHDFDEVGVPSGAGLAWRHRANEEWALRALVHQAERVDLLLAGQTPLGELLAAPSASRLEAISACLLDCDDATRVARLRTRGPEWLTRTGGTLRDHLTWARWMRGHAADPTARVEVIRSDTAWKEMRWSQWSGWRAGDPRWRVRVIDTSASPPASVAAELAEWIHEERALFRSGAHPLRGCELTAS